MFGFDAMPRRSLLEREPLHAAHHFTDGRLEAFDDRAIVMWFNIGVEERTLWRIFVNEGSRYLLDREGTG